MYYQDIICSLSSNKEEKLIFGEYIIEKKLREDLTVDSNL